MYNNKITYNFLNVILMADNSERVADKCEVIEPLELREAVINKLKNNKYNV